MGIALGTMLLALTLTPTSGVPLVSSTDASVTVPDAPQLVDMGTWDPTADVVPGQHAATPAPVVPPPSATPPSPSPPVAPQPVLPEPPTDWTLPLTPDGGVSTGAPAPEASSDDSSDAQDPPAPGSPASDAPRAPAPADAAPATRAPAPGESASTLSAMEPSPTDPPQLSRAQLGAMGAGIVLLCGWILALGLLARAKQR